MELYPSSPPTSISATAAPAESSTVLPASSARPNPGTLPQVTYTIVLHTNSPLSTSLHPTESVFQEPHLKSEPRLKLEPHLKVEPALDSLHLPCLPTCPQFPTLHCCRSYQLQVHAHP